MERIPFPEFSGNRDGWRVHCGVLGLFAVVTVVFTWPLFPYCLTHFISEPGAEGLGLPVRDAAQHHWNLWWMRFALFELHSNPYRCGYLYAPHGTPLALHTLCPLYGLISAPFQRILPLNAIYNLFLLAGYVFAGHGAWLLSRSLGAPSRGAIIAGALFMFFPIRPEMHVHLNIFSVQWIPYCVWAWLGLLNNGGRRWTIATAALQTGLFHVSLHLLYMTVMLQGGLFIWALRRSHPNPQERPWLKHSAAWGAAVFIAAMLALQFWKSIVALALAALFIVALIAGRTTAPELRKLAIRALNAALLTAVFCAPALLSMRKANAYAEYDRMLLAAQVALSADVTDYFVQPWLKEHMPAALRAAAESIAGRLEKMGFKTNHVTPFGRGFAPYSLYVLLLLGIGARQAMWRGWLALAIFFVVLSLGPCLKFFDFIEIAFPGRHSFFLLMPACLLRALPGGETMRVLLRFFIPALLCAIVAMSICWERVERRLKCTHGSAQWLVCGGVIAIVLLEGCPRGVMMDRWNPPQALSIVQELPASITVVNVPNFDQKWAGWNMAAQTVHCKRIHDGYISRLPMDLTRYSEKLGWPWPHDRNTVFLLHEDALAPEKLRALRARLQGFGYVSQQDGALSLWMINSIPPDASGVRGND
ncbi:hypothetical protein JXA32_15515 [Candidatus Sumerlaeota bacterium]|nr:hypothetical protein [Candidatus Sumerlaeota bacterium]